MRTHHLEQYAVPLGRKCLLYKRPHVKGRNYTHPVFIGVEWFKSRIEALKFKEQFDKPMKKEIRSEE